MMARRKKRGRGDERMSMPKSMPSAIAGVRQFQPKNYDVSSKMFEQYYGEGGREAVIHRLT